MLALQLPAMGQASTEFLDTVYIREQISKYESAGRSRRQPQLSDQEFAELEREIPYTGFTPLTEMGPGQTYKGQDGGLYGSGSNNPPPAHQKAALEAVAKITPRDEDGNPSADGKIVLMGIGMSNTRIIFDMFKQMAEADPGKADRVILVNAAAGGQDARAWADPTADYGRQLNLPGKGEKGSAWDYADAMLAAEGVTPAQVQAVWIYQALMNPGKRYGDFPGHAMLLKECIGVIVREAKRRYPNLQIVFLSSRTYAGYAARDLNPEPYAYESAFAVRWLIQEQIDGSPRYNYDPAAGPVAAPVMVWGPYLWADGVRPRLSDGLTWQREDFAPAPDGTHPSAMGARKAGQLLLDFFKTNELAKGWFLQSSD
ncbi:MAG: hypothetical protein WAQ49_03045 [Limnochordia bacterium]